MTNLLHLRQAPLPKKQDNHNYKHRYLQKKQQQQEEEDQSSFPDFSEELPVIKEKIVQAADSKRLNYTSLHVYKLHCLYYILIIFSFSDENKKKATKKKVKEWYDKLKQQSV